MAEQAQSDVTDSVTDRQETDPVTDRPEGRVRWREWLLLDGDRFAVAGAISLLFLVAVVLLEATGVIPLRKTMPTFYLFGGLIGGNLTLITVVVSINQMVLSREMHSPGELEEQIGNMFDYRSGVEEAAGRIAPAEPQGFLRVLYENARQEAQRLGGLTFEDGPPELRGEIDDLVTNLTDHADEIDRRLRASGTGIFDVLSVTLTTNYAHQINRLRRLRARHRDDLPEAAEDAVDGLVDRLREIDVARQYFKTIYLQSELSALSRILLYAGIPAEMAVAVYLLALTAASPSREVLFVVMPVAVAVGFLPLAVLTSFILRTATVTQRTTTTVPFTTPDQEVG